MTRWEEGLEINFEKALEELESIVEDLESGDLSLENSLKSFEKGKLLGLFLVISHAFSNPDKSEQILDNAAKDFGEKIITGRIEIK